MKRAQFDQAWGEGRGTAGLNLGDCSSATGRHVPLLFVGDDFARTDIDRA
jgi:ribonuclease VapC